MCVSAKAQEEKCVESLQKKTMGVIFHIQNSQLLVWSSLTEEIFQVHCQNRRVANAINKATQYVTFGFPFPISVFFSF